MYKTDNMTEMQRGECSSYVKMYRRSFYEEKNCDNFADIVYGFGQCSFAAGDQGEDWSV